MTIVCLVSHFCSLLESISVSLSFYKHIWHHKVYNFTAVQNTSKYLSRKLPVLEVPIYLTAAGGNGDLFLLWS